MSGTPSDPSSQPERAPDADAPLEPFAIAYED
jgi:hypothetical protein